MGYFSERNGYTTPAIIREDITEGIRNSICSVYDNIEDALKDIGHDELFVNFKRCIWTDFMNQRVTNFSLKYTDVISYIEDGTFSWYEVLDLIEFSIRYFSTIKKEYPLERDLIYVLDAFIPCLNSEFKRLNFAYRIVDNIVVEITSKTEIKNIENAINNSSEKIKAHLKSALSLYAKRPAPDYRNSIKEAISAVEVLCREETGKKTLAEALSELETTGIKINPILKVAFEKLYAYTNQPDTGIRHALMEPTYNPTDAEAYFMIVSCSAFINYLIRIKTL